MSRSAKAGTSDRSGSGSGKTNITPRDIRRAAFSVLYQLDARDGQDLEDIRAFVEEQDNLTDAARKKVLMLATNAWNDRKAADEHTSRLAPNWPAHRQAAVDRTILRLAHYEMTSGVTPPKAAVNEAIILAKAFGTEKSPAFINALLDKVLKEVLRAESTQTQAQMTDDDPAPGDDAIIASEEG